MSGKEECLRLCRVRLLEGKEAWGAATTSQSTPNSLSPNSSGSRKRVSLSLLGGEVGAIGIAGWAGSPSEARAARSPDQRGGERSGWSRAGFMGLQREPSGLWARRLAPAEEGGVRLLRAQPAGGPRGWGGAERGWREKGRRGSGAATETQRSGRRRQALTGLPDPWTRRQMTSSMLAPRSPRTVSQDRCTRRE